MCLKKWRLDKTITKLCFEFTHYDIIHIWKFFWFDSLCKHLLTFFIFIVIWSHCILKQAFIYLGLCNICNFSHRITNINKGKQDSFKSIIHIEKCLICEIIILIFVFSLIRMESTQQQQSTPVGETNANGNIGSHNNCIHNGQKVSGDGCSICKQVSFFKKICIKCEHWKINTIILPFCIFSEW